jgi:hypothetical protein
MSTFAVLYLLDMAWYNPNLSCGIVSYSLEHAQHIFKKIIGHALDTMHPLIAKSYNPIKQRSAREIAFTNGSVIRVDTTLRGGAYQYVLVSEFGKTCVRDLLKAEEVITGTLQSVPEDGTIIIESTGEGNSGFFAELVSMANQRGENDLSNLEYRLFFFPWYLEPSYQIDCSTPYGVIYSDYFKKLAKEGIVLSEKQKQWYVFQSQVLGDRVRQEYPSTISEAFLSTSDAYYFQSSIEAAYNSKRCVGIDLYDPTEQVYVAMDIGVNDLTVMVFFQVLHGEIRIIDYYENNGQGVDHYVKHMLQDKRYLYHTVFLPHDAVQRDGLVVENSYEKDFKRLLQHTNAKVVVLKRTDKNLNINNAKIKFTRCVFSINKVKPLLDQLSKYRKKWSEQYGKYLDEPYHDTSSNYADAMIYAMQGVTHIETVVSTKGALEKHREVVASRSERF